MKESTYRSFYHLLFDQARFGIVILSSKGSFIDVNPFICNLLGYSHDELLKLTFFSLIYPEDIALGTAENDTVEEGNTIFKERKLLKKDGELITTEVHSRKLEKDRILVLIEDISGHEKARQASEEKYRQIADNTSDVIWIMNEKMEYTYVSPSIFRQRGFTPDEFLNLKPEEIYPPESRKKAVDVYQYGLQLIKGGNLPPNFSVTIELQHFCKDGSLKDSEVIISPIIDAEGILKGGHGVSRDITERMKTDRALKESEERFRLAFQTSPDSINIHNMETGEYVEVNDGFTRLTGYTREDVTGKTSFTTNIWENFEDRARMIELLQKDGSVSNFEARFRFKDGTVHTGLLSASVIRLNGIQHIISIVRDIEKLKKAERDIVKAMETAEEASRLKTAFLNNISHEVRTPMNAILGFTELIRDEDINGPERDRFFGIITSNARQLLSIIDDVLEISRMDSGRIPFNPAAFSLHEMMEDIHLSMNEMVVRKGLGFFFSHDDMGSSNHVIADKDKIRQVITGLIGNSIKFTANGKISFGYVKRSNEIEFFVRDTGIGIHETEHEKIFERFYQVENVSVEGTRGAGLGLSIARGLAEVMGGYNTGRIIPRIRISILYHCTLPGTFITRGSGRK
ncbi:MAG: PAS domain S-box protein [Bacteroidota bacterium]